MAFLFLFTGTFNWVLTALTRLILFIQRDINGFPLNRLDSTKYPVQEGYCDFRYN